MKRQIDQAKANMRQFQDASNLCDAVKGVANHVTATRAEKLKQRQGKQNVSSLKPSQTIHEESGLEGFIDVPTKNSTSKKKPIRENHAPMVGVRLWKVSDSDQATVQAASIKSFLGFIATLDPDSVLLPHNQSTNRAVEISDAITIPESQVKSFFDIQVNRWGHARENKWRTDLSFYLHSDLIGKNLKEVYQAQDSKDWRTKTGWRMTTHTLQESDDQEIGFFMGKAVKFAWRDDMAVRIKEHIDPLASTESLQADSCLST
jgi:hypothetical protein